MITARNTACATAMVSLLVSAVAAQTEVKVSTDIATSTTWTANNTYNLQKQIFVLPGATLTIQAGTVIASDTNLGGSLAVAKGAQIYVQGTEQKPVIMTSKADVATWKNGDPRTGTWRESANEWGNLTIMGAAYISEDKPGGNYTNTKAPNANNVGSMEGLVAASANDTKVLYGGGNDDDNSGSISYLSLRYGGKVVALNNELNGLSLGGIGRATDIHHVEIMNNVDDGIEIWGGTVNIKNFSIWNVGDDSFDVDQGWRGKAQFGLIVQGYSLDAKQGSGLGDNAFETDGAENSDYQPVTTASIYNCTVVGEPNSGDHATAWRDNARVQYRNCVFMDCGEQAVKFDNIDGDGGQGYGYSGTLSWPNTWTTAYNVYSNVNAPSNPAAFYKAQASGMLAEIKDSVFYNLTNSSAYTEADARGVFATTNYNVKNATSMPVKALTRSAIALKGGKPTTRVTYLDPRPAADALTSNAFAPNDGFFTEASYRGAFAPGADWLNGWTASSAYGLTPKTPFTDLGKGLGGSKGAPVLGGTGTFAGNTSVTLTLSNAAANAPTIMVLGSARIDVALFGGTLIPNVDAGTIAPILTDGSGNANLTFTVPSNFPSGGVVYWQQFVLDAMSPQGFAISNGVLTTAP